MKGVAVQVRAAAGLCVGDCDGDGTVAVSELLAGVRMALTDSSGGACAGYDADGSGDVTIDELVASLRPLSVEPKGTDA